MKKKMMTILAAAALTSTMTGFSASPAETNVASIDRATDGGAQPQFLGPAICTVFNFC